MLELTTRFVGITTAKRRSGKQLAVQAAADHAKANLRYIMRESATQSEDLITQNLGESAEGEAVDRLLVRQIMAKTIEAKAQTGGRRGVRIAEKIVLSLPNDMKGEPAREAVRTIVRRLAGGSPHVKIVAAIHTDRPNNLHAHLLVLDGLETEAMAKLRASSETKRVRPRYMVRLGDRGRPKEVRQLIAVAINEVADRHGLTHVEARSFRDRGLQRSRRQHVGPQKKARVAKLATSDVFSDLFTPANELFGELTGAHTLSKDEAIQTLEAAFQAAQHAIGGVARGYSR